MPAKENKDLIFTQDEPQLVISQSGNNILSVNNPSNLVFRAILHVLLINDFCNKLYNLFITREGHGIVRTL